MNYETTRFDADDVVNGGGAGGTVDGIEGRSSRRRNVIIAAVLIAIVLIAALLYFRPGTPAGDDAAGAGDAAAQAPTVTIIVPGRETVSRVLNATGNLAARREMPVGIAGEGGQVVRVLVEPGQWVGAGQVLAVIDQSVQSQQAASASANIAVAQADADIAQSNLDRALQLVERGFISKADVDRLTATRDAAAARVRVAQAQLGERQALNRRLNIVAPAAGLVLTRAVEPGQVVNSGSGVLFRMAKGGEMELLAQLSEADLATLPVGVSATITPAGTEKEFTGQVWQVSPVIDGTNRQGIARIALAYDPALRPGGFASARITSGAQAAPVLPESAVQSDDKGSYVYVVNAQNKIERRDIVLGNVTAQGIVIQSGLAGNEKIVLYAAGFLNPGETVKPVAREANSER